jgi:hypothetical protein
MAYVANGRSPYLQTKRRCPGPQQPPRVRGQTASLHLTGAYVTESDWGTNRPDLLDEIFTPAQLSGVILILGPEAVVGVERFAESGVASELPDKVRVGSAGYQRGDCKVAQRVPSPQMFRKLR